MVKNIYCYSNFMDIDFIRQRMENILNAEHGTVVREPIVFVTADSSGENARVHVIISYTPNTNNGYVKVNCSLTTPRDFDILTIESDYPVSLGIAGRYHSDVVAVWTETVSNESHEAE